MDARLIAAPSRRLGRIAVALALVAFAAGCTSAPPATSTLAPVTPLPSTAATTPPASTPPPATPAPLFPANLSDDEGTAVALKAEPRKIISLTPAATETLFALGIGDRVIGKVEDFTPYPADAAKVPDVAKFGSVDVEKIVSLGADLVIAGGNNFNPPESITKLRSLGVPVLVIFAPDSKTALADITLIGRATGKVDEAAKVDAAITAAFSAVQAAVAGQATPRVYYELDATNGYFGPAPNYFGTEMIKLAGGVPLTSGTKDVYQIDPEKIIAFDPQVILLGDAAYGVTQDQVGKRPGWSVLAAVKSGDVRPINDTVVTRPGPRLAQGIVDLANAIHPSLGLPGGTPPEASAAPSASTNP